MLPYAHFWYLQATFLIMTAFILLSWLTGGRGRLAAAILACVGVTGWLLMPRPAVDVFSMAGAMRLGPFFAAGYFAARGLVWSRSRERDVRQRRTGAVILGLLLCCAVALATGAVILPAVAQLRGLGDRDGQLPCAADAAAVLDPHGLARSAVLCDLFVPRLFYRRAARHASDGGTGP